MPETPELALRRKLAIAGDIAGKTVGASVKKRRWLRGILAGASAAARSLLRVAHILWLEVTGFFFLCFAIVGGFAVQREVRLHAPDTKIAILVAFTAMFTWFGVSSFWRARKR